jgi:hypothetical protein
MPFSVGKRGQESKALNMGLVDGGPSCDRSI